MLVVLNKFVVQNIFLEHGIYLDFGTFMKITVFFNVRTFSVFGSFENLVLKCWEQRCWRFESVWCGESFSDLESFWCLTPFFNSAVYRVWSRSEIYNQVRVEIVVSGNIVRKTWM